MFRTTLLAATATAATVVLAQSAIAQSELNLYSSRHYDTDERLYAGFEEQTGIQINRIEAKADELIERMRAEGANSPADVLLTVDAGRAGRALQAGLLQSIDSDVLNDRIPAHLRDPGGAWYGFSQRARIIFYARDRVDNPPTTYEALTDPAYEGQICARSSSNIYMISLLASIIEAHGADVATEWAAGLLRNLARSPQGGDTDQLRGLASGECDIAIANTYYFARALRKDVDRLSELAEGIGWVFPNQDGRGAHVNISAGGVARHAPNRDAAIAFLEYLASPEAQRYFSAGNDEFPVTEGAELSESVEALGPFVSDTLNLEALYRNAPAAVQIYDAVGYP